MAPLLLIGAALGGTAMYFFDPDRGRRRRALVRDRAIKASRKTGELFEAGARDLANRASAVPHQLHGVFHHDRVADRVLAQRVRSKMGRYVSHPHAVEVSATDGSVTLRGSILAREHGPFLHAVRHVHGVREAIDRLAVYQTARGVSELQGGRERRGERLEIFQDNWSPGTRLLTGATASVLALYALRHGGVCGIAALLFGAALFTRTTANRPWRDIAHFGAPLHAQPEAPPDYYSVKLESANEPDSGGEEAGRRDVAPPM